MGQGKSWSARSMGPTTPGILVRTNFCHADFLDHCERFSFLRGGGVVQSRGEGEGKRDRVRVKALVLYNLGERQQTLPAGPSINPFPRLHLPPASHPATRGLLPAL